MLKTYRGQFRDRNQFGFNAQYGTKPNGKAPRQRPTAVKQPSPRSDSYALPAKRNETIYRVPNVGPKRQHFQKTPPSPPTPPRKIRPIRNFSTPPENRRLAPLRRNDVSRTIPNNRRSYIDEERPRRPLRLNTEYNGPYQSASPPAYNRKFIPLPRNEPYQQRRVRRSGDEYVPERRRPPSYYAYDDYPSDKERARQESTRFGRVARETPRRYDDDIDYPQSSRPRVVIRRVPARDYIFVDETEEPVRRAQSRRSDTVYVEDERERPPVEYEDEYIYVDEYGNKVEIVEEPPPRRRYVEYADDDENYRRRPKRKTEVIYVGDEPSTSRSKGDKSKSKNASSKRVADN